MEFSLHRQLKEHYAGRRAKFEVKFEDSTATRMVTVRPPKAAQYTRDSDSTIIEEWLRKRGFIVMTKVPDAEPQILASA